MNRTQLLAIAVALVLGFPAAAGQLEVGSGATFALDTGSMDLGCADLAVSGTLSAGSVGFSQARDVSINPSGTVNGGSATLQVTGNWNNAGSFNAGTSTLNLVNGCALFSSVISGNSSFANLNMTTTAGKLYSFVSGSTQTVTGSMTLLGAIGNLLTIRSTINGVAAFLDVQGSQSVDYVDVQDNSAVGAPILLGPNSVKGLNSPGWNFPIPVPSLGFLGLAVLTLALLLASGATLRGRKLLRG